MVVGCGEVWGHRVLWVVGGARGGEEGGGGWGDRLLAALFNLLGPWGAQEAPVHDVVCRAESEENGVQIRPLNCLDPHIFAIVRGVPILRYIDLAAIREEMNHGEIIA